MVSAAILVAGMLLQGESAATTGATAPLVIDDPQWLSRPTPSQATRLYPMKAMRNEKTGVVLVHCIAKADGALRDCSVLCETPAGYGFGEAGLAMTKYFRTQPLLPDGRSVEGGSVRFPIYFFPSFLPRPQLCAPTRP